MQTEPADGVHAAVAGHGGPEERPHARSELAGRPPSPLDSARGAGFPSNSAGDGPPAAYNQRSTTDDRMMCSNPGCPKTIRWYPQPPRGPGNLFHPPLAVTTPVRLQCARCGIRYCSPRCMGGHYTHGHRDVCPLPPFDASRDNAIYDDGGWCVPVRCVDESELRLGLLTACITYPHTTPCLICGRGECTTASGAHITVIEVLVGRIRHGLPSELASRKRPMTYPTIEWYGEYQPQVGSFPDGYGPRTMFSEGPIRVRNLEGNATAFWDSPTDASSESESEPDQPDAGPA